jgi:hypothetical protein
METNERLDRLEKSIERLEASQEKTDLVIRRLGRYAMVIARIHDDELGSHTKRILALEEEGLDGDVATR